MGKGERAFYIFLTIVCLVISFFVVAGVSYFFCWAFEWDVWSWKFTFFAWAIGLVSSWLLRLGDHKSDE